MIRGSIVKISTYCTVRVCTVSRNSWRSRLPTGVSSYIIVCVSSRGPYNRFQQMLLVGFGEEERPGQQNLRPIILAAAWSSQLNKTGLVLRGCWPASQPANPAPMKWQKGPPLKIFVKKDHLPPPPMPAPPPAASTKPGTPPAASTKAGTWPC
jgi:hypothetical protein